MFAIIACMDLANAVTAVVTAVDGLRTAPVHSGSPTDLRTALKALKNADSKLQAQLARLMHAADTAGSHIGTGARDSAEWLGRETGTSTARNRVNTRLGEAMERSTQLADAVENGELSADKANLMVSAASDEIVDKQLIDEVAGLALNAVKPAVESWRARNHPDRDADVAAAQRSRRYLRLTGTADGMTRVDGLLDPESGSIIRSALDGLMSQSYADGTTRTSEQRCADAFTQLCTASAKGDIKGGRSNTKLLVTVPFETITERGHERGITNVGSTIDAATARKMACDAGIHRVITGARSSIIDFGHDTRLVPDNLFLALVTRDQHCRWPGCTIRPTWCDAHHIIHWTCDGPTDDENCVLLCHHHHQLSHQPGWSMSGTGSELRIEHPDGTSEISKPPGIRQPTSGAPPKPDTTQVANIGQEQRNHHGLTHEPPSGAVSEQLTLA